MVAPRFEPSMKPDPARRKIRAEIEVQRVWRRVSRVVPARLFVDHRPRHHELPAEPQCARSGDPALPPPVARALPAADLVEKPAVGSNEEMAASAAAELCRRGIVEKPLTR